jgi:hypothetical protein
MTDETGERLGAVEKELTSLGRDVGKLRVLAEENASTIRLIAEGHGAMLDSHSRKLDSLGRRLDDVFTALEPLQQIKDFIERVADEHELRITALEKREGEDLRSIRQAEENEQCAVERLRLFSCKGT